MTKGKWDALGFGCGTPSGGMGGARGAAIVGGASFNGGGAAIAGAGGKTGVGGRLKPDPPGGFGDPLAPGACSPRSLTPPEMMRVYSLGPVWTGEGLERRSPLGTEKTRVAPFCRGGPASRIVEPTVCSGRIGRSEGVAAVCTGTGVGAVVQRGSLEVEGGDISTFGDISFVGIGSQVRAGRFAGGEVAD
jgi:hypothetical protein